MITRKDFAVNYLSRLGYLVNTEALQIIKACEEWYKNRVIEDFHKRKNLNNKEIKLKQMNFAKRCCADDANLCEIISVATQKNNQSQEFINNLLSSNRFNIRYREQLEKTSAAGTVGAYVCLKNARYIESEDGTTKIKDGEIRINYIDADSILPLTVDNLLITECAFFGTDRAKGKEKTQCH